MTIYNETPYRDEYWLIAVEQVEPYRIVRDSATFYVANGQHFDTCEPLVITLNTWLEQFDGMNVTVAVKTRNGRQHWAVETFDCSIPMAQIEQDARETLAALACI